MKNSLKDRLKQIEKEVSKNINPKKFDFIIDGSDGNPSVQDLIRKRTLLGRGVPSDGSSSESLKKLSDSYVLYRKGELTFRTNKTTGAIFPIINTMKDYLIVGKTVKKGKVGENVKISYKKVNLKDRFKPIELSSKTTPKKSNLTLTGKMLDDIVGWRRGFKFIFTFKTTLSKQKAEWAAEGGRRFFDLSKSERSGLQRRISDTIAQEIIKMFNSQN